MDQLDRKLLFPDGHPSGDFRSIALATYKRLSQALHRGERIGEYVQGHTGSDGIESVVLTAGQRDGEIFFSAATGFTRHTSMIFIEVHNYDSGREYWLDQDDPRVVPYVMGKIAAAFGLTPG